MAREWALRRAPQRGASCSKTVTVARSICCGQRLIAEMPTHQAAPLLLDEGRGGSVIANRPATF